MKDDNTSDESHALIEMNYKDDRTSFADKFFSHDYKEDEYNYKIFETDSKVDEAVEALNSWTAISRLNVIIRFSIV